MVKVFKDNNLNLGIVYISNGLVEAIDWAKKEIQNSKSKNIQELYNYQKNKEVVNLLIKKYQFYGTDSYEEVINDKNTYIHPERLQELLQEFNKKIDDINITELNQKKTITFNDREVGMFSFDLASIGLLPVFEYYSPYLKTTVNPMDVKSRLIDETNEREFYHVPLNYIPEHKIVIEGPKYYSPILEMYVDINDIEPNFDDDGVLYYIYPKKEAIPEHIVIQRTVLMDNGLPKYTSTWKKSFIYLEKNPYQLPQIDIILNSAFSSKKNAKKDFIYNVLAPTAILTALNKLNIKNRVFNINVGVEIVKKQEYIAGFITKIKNLNTPIDYNSLAIITGDARFYRYDTFIQIIANFSAIGFGDKLGTGLATPINNNLFNIQVFNKTITDAKDFGEADPKYYIGNNESNKIVFPTCTTMAEAEKAYSDAINKIKTLLSK